MAAAAELADKRERESEVKGLDKETTAFLSHAMLSLPPPHATLHLLSLGVCVRCIFRLFGVEGRVYASQYITACVLQSFVEKQESVTNVSSEGHTSNGLSLHTDSSHHYCSICLGILQLAFGQDQENKQNFTKENTVDDFIEAIVDHVKRENHHIDGFSIDVSIPPVIMANERAIRLYMKNTYQSEEWFQNKFPSQHISVKDALRFSITTSLEDHLNVKSGSSSFRIWLKYTHFEASKELQNSLSHDSNKRKAGGLIGSNFTEAHENMQSHNDSDAAILRTLESLQDHAFCDLFTMPPKKTLKPCILSTTCYRRPIYIGGRYLKFSRKVSQTRWIIDDERMGEASVEEIIGNNALLVCKGDTYKFHAAGREDIDVRMLGSGRPFLVEISNARCMSYEVDIDLISQKINNTNQKFVRVKNLKVMGNEAWSLMREGEAEKQKQYSALVWISRPLTDEDTQSLTSKENMGILQKTPIRVLHRRSSMERKKVVHWMKVERISNSCQYFMLHLCTQAGTYIKEFVHGDLGRTSPSVGSILGCRAEILQLDVTDVKMDIFMDEIMPSCS